MNKPRIITILVLIVALVYVSLAINEDTTTVIQSRTNCCSITINYTKGTVRYVAPEGDDTTTFSSKEQLDEEINTAQEYCYHHHLNQ